MVPWRLVYCDSEEIKRKINKKFRRSPGLRFVFSATLRADVRFFNRENASEKKYQRGVKLKKSSTPIIQARVTVNSLSHSHSLLLKARYIKYCNIYISSKSIMNEETSNKKVCDINDHVILEQNIDVLFPV